MMPRREISERWRCRLCAGTMIKVFALAPSPIANDYADEPDENAHRYPLELSQCSRCGHVQQRFVVHGLFSDYKYSTPQTVARYLEPFVDKLRVEHPKAKRVLEIGSNNGTYLRLLREKGFDATGVDPAATGFDNHVAYFTSNWAYKHHERYDLILANNVFAHIDNLEDVFRGIQHVLIDDGAVIFEVQYWPALVDACAYDMIYAEHVSYHALLPLGKFFLPRRGFMMTDYEFIPTHGGSIRVTAKRISREYPQLRVEEQKMYAKDWSKFAERVNEAKESLRARLFGRKVVLLGAAAKATTLIHHCGIAEHILFACDDTPAKIGKYLPGTNIQIKPTSELGSQPAILCAWNYEKEFREKFPKNEFIKPINEKVKEAA